MFELEGVFIVAIIECMTRYVIPSLRKADKRVAGLDGTLRGNAKSVEDLLDQARCLGYSPESIIGVYRKKDEVISVGYEKRGTKEESSQSNQPTKDRRKIDRRGISREAYLSMQLYLRDHGDRRCWEERRKA